MREFQQVETVVHTTPLGIRCVDISTGARVSSGLQITATGTGAAAHAVTALTTLSGTYAFHGLPGLHDIEYEDSTTGPVTVSSPPSKEFAIQLNDLERRYLPWGVVLALPKEDVLGAFLFSSPSRPKVAGLMVIRGALADATRLGIDGKPLPAAHARIEAKLNATVAPTVYVGLADARGQF